MNILFVSHKYPPSIGGMQTFSYALINGIGEKCTVTRITKLKTESELDFFLHVNNSIVAALNNDTTISIVHVVDGTLAIRVGKIIPRYPNIKFCVTIHGLEATFPLGIYRSYFTKRIRLFDKVFCVSNNTHHLVMGCGIAIEKITIITNGTEPEVNKEKLAVSKNIIQKYKHLENKKIILSVGRSVERKGFYWFAKNVIPLLKDDIIYLVVGPKEKEHFRLFGMLPKKIQLIYELAIGYGSDYIKIKSLNAKNVILTGPVSQTELSYLYKLAKVVIMPNQPVKGDVEGFGLVAIEASLRGKVVVVSNIEGLTDAIHDAKNGYLLPPENPMFWAKKINHIIENEVDYKIFGSKAMAYSSQHFDIQSMLDKYISEFKQMVNIKPIHIE